MSTTARQPLRGKEWFWDGKTVVHVTNVTRTTLNVEFTDHGRRGIMHIDRFLDKYRPYDLDIAIAEFEREVAI